MWTRVSMVEDENLDPDWNFQLCRNSVPPVFLNVHQRNLGTKTSTIVLFLFLLSWERIGLGI
jgi:hypothetical protein